MRKLKAFDTFSGYGGFTLAMQEHGIETVGFSEIDEYASGVLAYRFPKVVNYGDIDTIDCEGNLPSFDILTGGFPCQDLSVAGERQGLSGERSGLFYSWLTILRRKAPSYFILENVKGLYSSAKGWDFAELLYQVSNAGIGYDVQWGTVNSNIFTPQNRERVFIVGCARDVRTRQVFPIEGTDREVQIGSEISYCIDANYYKGISPQWYTSKRRQLIQVGNVDSKGHNSLWGRVYDPKGLAVTLKAEGGGLGAKTGLYALTERRTEEARAIRREALKQGRDYSPRRGKELVPRNDGLANCLTTGMTYEHLLYSPEDTRIRRLTPRECERLMGIPDDWTRYYMQENGNVREVSDTQRYRMCGNGVVPQVITEIIRRLICT